MYYICLREKHYQQNERLRREEIRQGESWTLLRMTQKEGLGDVTILFSR
jgi:hypothetical protein